MLRLPILSLFLLVASAPLLAAEPETTKLLTFEADVRPILKAACFHCHGEEENPKAKLDLRLVRLIQVGGDSGAAIVPGKSTESSLHERIVSGEMPPGEKKLTPTEIATITAWIDQGAKTLRPEPTQLPDLPFSEVERSFWSFQPISRPALPAVKNSSRIRTPIDQFLLAKLEERALMFSPEADRRTLIRRLSIDLTGLPPQPAAVEEFLADEAPDAYERLVDRLLASPRYGERWGRHWLDVAGYADSDGFGEKDLERKYAYKYRDYVIRSFNEDKPWDQFLVEQVAGDELLTPPYANLNTIQADKLIATGFLRMGPDGTGDGEVNQEIARNEVMSETIKIVSTSLLGLTVGCAQCHNHRYDPISQVDYYKFRALFEPAYDWKNWRAPQARLVSLWSDEQKKVAADVDVQLKTLNDERVSGLEAIVKEVFEREVGKLPEANRDAARKARETPADKRTPEQQQILKDTPSLNVDTGSVYLYEQKRIKEYNEKYDKLNADLKARRPPEDFAQCLTEVPGSIPKTNLFYRGAFNQPKQEVEPGELTVLCSTPAIKPMPLDDPQLPTSGRRLAYAKNLTSGQHPLVARVLVNRFWMQHFGKGIVSTPGDFGMLGSRPTHPELLDWLASEFMQNGWKLKPFHRLIVLSTAYRQTSRRPEQLDAVDPENRYLGRMNVRRIEAEVLRDAILSASGTLFDRMQGPPVPVTPDEVGQIIVGLDNRDAAGVPMKTRPSLGGEATRRSVYVQVRRSMPVSMLETFDAPDMRPNCELRNSSTVSPQSLLLMNNDFVLEHAATFARRLEAQAGADVPAQIRLAWQFALAREPSAAQLASAQAFLVAQTADFTATPLTEKDAPTPAQRALASYCQVLLSSNRFLYVD